MSFRVNILMDQKILAFTTDIPYIKKISMHTHMIEPLDQIYEISITKNLFIITTEDPYFRNENTVDPAFKQCQSANNINAYDWNGTHIWNIADIVGDIHMPFFGGSVCSKELLNSYPGFEASKVKSEHELFSCTAGDYLYIVDLTDKKLIQKLETR